MVDFVFNVQVFGTFQMLLKLKHKNKKIIGILSAIFSPSVHYIILYYIKCEVRCYFRNYAINTKFDAVRIGRVDKLLNFSLVFTRA